MMGGMPSVLLVLAVLCTGLYAGYLLAFHSGVMPALRDVGDAQFTQVMRLINKKVPGPVFLLLFLGAVGLPAASLAVAEDGRTGAEQALVVAALACSAVGHLVTAAGNVPLNNALEAAGSDDVRASRTAFESRWNTLHRVRTLLAVVAFALLAVVAA